MKYHFIHERGDYPILAVEDIGSAWSSSIKKVVGYGDSPVFFIYKNGWARIFGMERRYQQIVGCVWEKINQDKNYVVKVKKELQRRGKKFLLFINKIKKLDLRLLSNKDLIRIKKEYDRFYHRTAPYGEPVPYFLKDKVQTVLDEYLLVEKKITIGEYQKLITPVYLSFLEREKRELYKLAKIKNIKWRDKALDKHTAKYQWIHFDYASLIVDKEYFKKQLNELKKNPPKKYNEKLAVAGKKRLIDKHKLSPFTKYLLKILDQAYFLMDAKKEVLTQAHFAISEVYQEIGKRLGLSLKEIRWLLWREVKQTLLKKSKISRKLIKQRKNFSAGKTVNGVTRFLSLNDLHVLLADIAKDQKVDRKIKEIKGVVGSPGHVRGRIRYLKSARECGKVKQGEILLVSNTTPDFMPAIRHAKAIVTNEGGITCHAAIVSRELKIPCIVGTKIATQVLKTGDWVEVDANIGVIKRNN